MAREVIIRMSDDLDRSQEASKVEHIGFRGFIYELDLTDEHATELAGILAPYIKAAHEKIKWPKKSVKEAQKVSTVTRPSGGQPSNMTAEERKEARAWGRANGFEVADRGFLSPDLVASYKKAHRNGRR